MNDAAYLRWQAIVERETLGEPISSDEREFRGDFEAEHPECAAETEAWSALLGALGGDMPEAEADDDLAAKILAAARSTSTSAGPFASARDAATTSAGPFASARDTATTSADHVPRASISSATSGTNATSTTSPPLASVHALAPRRPIAAIVGGLAAITAAAAALALWWSGAAEDEGPRPTIADADSTTPPAAHTAPPVKIPDAPTPLAEVEPVIVAMASPGRLQVDGVALGVGMSLGEGATIQADDGACLVFRGPFAAVCLGAGAEARITGARGGVREVALTRGRLVATLDPVGPGQSFTVTTSAGGARAIGTIFAVEVAGPTIDVGVVEGKIEVRKAGDAGAHPLIAGERTTMADPAVTSPLGGDLSTWSKGQAEISALWKGDADAAHLSIGEAKGLALAIDGVALPAQGELELLIAAGPHALTSRGARGEARTRTIVGDPAAPTRLGRAELGARAGSRPSAGEPPSVGSIPPSTPAPPEKPSIDELRRAAADARGDRRWQDAAAAYRSLVDAYPSTPEADNARYQLADLLRVRLGRPDAALEQFDAYLARGGPLAAEARVGKIRCLQALGRSDDEAAAIAEYLDRHPDHIEVDKFRKRARELAGR